jgi:hypothetical protein
MRLKLFFALPYLMFSMIENAGAFDITSFMKEGMTQTQISLSEHFQTQLNPGASCPAGGSETVDGLAERKGTLRTAMGTMQSVLNQAQETVKARQADQSRCGTCHQVNVVSAYVTVYPEKVVLNPNCNNRPSRTFSRDFPTTQDAKSYSQAILQGDGNEGASLVNVCPNPCAYYITTAQTALPRGGTHLTLTIQCGEPRRDSIFSASYDFKSGALHQWSCTQ